MKTPHYYIKIAGQNQYRKTGSASTYTYYPANRTMVLNK